MLSSSKAARPASDDSLAKYRAKRNFDCTPEPAGGGESQQGTLQFVIQKHWASRLHYDLRLELDGTMKSWAVPKGPSFDPKDKRMAVQVEDHPIAYNTFEGQIPARQYGAGRVIVWDKGVWHPVGDAAEGYREGKLKFVLVGHKLAGHWTLVRMHGRKNEKQPAWLLIKEHDEFERAAADFSVVDAMPDSVSELPAPGSAPAALSQGRKAALPATLAPQLATLVEAAPQDPENWVFELKFDGYRLLARVEKGKARLFTRVGNDWTSKMPALAKAIAALPIQSGWLDGEILMLDANGMPDFQALQNAFDGSATRQIVYTVFDLPFFDGQDLRQLPVTERRKHLRLLIDAASSPLLRFSEAFDAKPQDLVASACKIGFEGVIGKRRDSVYQSRRSADWIKLKCSHRQEFVIGGYTDPQGGRTGLGSLLLGVHDASGALQYAGKVGTGFTERSLAELKAQLTRFAASVCPFAEPRSIGKKGVHWIEPRLLAEVSFAEWTASRHIRHSVFHGLRSDKPAKDIVKEDAAPAARSKASASRKALLRSPGKSNKRMSVVTTQKSLPPSARLPASFRVSHADRVIDEESGLTKIDLVRYYALVAPLIMEHLADRPTALVRAPTGVGGELFFQKHQEKGQMPGIAQLNPALYVGHPPLLEVATPEGLLSAAQMNGVEFHTWNARKDRIDRPDRMTFDLDPGEGVSWAQVQEAAQLARVFLQELGLPAFLKTSGGKGLHVVVPLKRLHDWDTIKDFSQAIVNHLARAIPQRFVAKSGPKNRIGKIFVDYLRNGWGATTVSAWSARARPGLGISVPVTWDELESITGGAHWQLGTVEPRLSVGNAPWEGCAKAAVALGAGMKRLGYDAAQPAVAPAKNRAGKAASDSVPSARIRKEQSGSIVSRRKAPIAGGRTTATQGRAKKAAS